MLISCAGEAQRVLQSLQDTFRTKATSTLKIRVGSMSLYVGWHRLSYPDDDIFPIDEAKAYEYACMCRDTKASASRVDTFVSTLRFLGEFLEFEGASAAATSPRVQGASHQMLLARPPRIRARMLTIGMLCWLEIACFAMHHAFDRMVAGLCMLCCMGRLRWIAGKVFGGLAYKNQDSAEQRKGNFFYSFGGACFWHSGKALATGVPSSETRTGLARVADFSIKSA